MKTIKAIWGIIVAMAWWVAIMLGLGVFIGVTTTAIAVPVSFIWRIFQ